MNYYSVFLNGEYQATYMAKTKEDAEHQARKNGIKFDEMKGDK